MSTATIEKTFPNGFDSWQETHFEIVQHLASTLDNELEPAFKSMALRAQESGGHGALYEMAEALTDEFEKIYEGTAWDGEFFDAIEDYLKRKEELARMSY